MRKTWGMALILGAVLAHSPAHAGTAHGRCAAAELSPESLYALTRAENYEKPTTPLPVVPPDHAFCMEIELPRIAFDAPDLERSQGWSRSDSGSTFVSYSWPSNAYYTFNDRDGDSRVRRLQTWRRAGDFPKTRPMTLVMMEYGKGFGRGQFTAEPVIFRSDQKWLIIIRGVMVAPPKHRLEPCMGGTLCTIPVQFRSLAMLEMNEGEVFAEWDLVTDSVTRKISMGIERDGKCFDTRGKPMKCL